MATEEIWAFNSQNNQNEIIRLLSQDVNLNQETKRGLQKLTVNVNKVNYLNVTDKLLVC